MSLSDWVAWQAAITIKLDDTVEPVIQPPRRVPYSPLEKLKKKLQELEEKDIIHSLG